MTRPAPAAAPIHYPSSDGRPMAENDAQRSAIMYGIGALARHFRDRPDIYVSGDLLIYYEEGNPRVSIAPDVFVVFGVEKRQRLNYKLWEERRAPAFVLEVASPSTWRDDVGRKRSVYARLGVRECSAIMYVIGALARHFRDRPDVYVSGDLLIYYEEGNPRVSIAPDVFVVFGVEKRQRPNYKLWEERRAPAFVLEVASPSTWRDDVGRKRSVYARLGVREYCRYDPAGEHLPTRLEGERLSPAGYVRQPALTALDGTLTLPSETLGLELRAAPGRELRFRDPATGGDLRSHDEEAEGRLAAEERRRAAEEGCLTAEEGRRAAEERRRSAEEHRRSAEEHRRSAEEGPPGRRSPRRGRPSAGGRAGSAPSRAVRLIRTTSSSTIPSARWTVGTCFPYERRALEAASPRVWRLGESCAPPRPREAPTMIRPAPAAAPIHYPSSDGRPMAENDAQRSAITYGIGALARHFRDLPDVQAGHV